MLQQKIIQLANSNNYLSQQLQQCNLNTKLLEVEKSSMADKLLFFDRSLETVAQAISNNISSGEQRINMLADLINKNKTANREANINLIVRPGEPIDIAVPPVPVEVP
jgi:hypothetical protein